MKLKNLDKATKIYSAIQELDKEIIKIEKRANELANGNFEVSVKLDFKSLDPKAKKVKFDEDGSLCIEDNRNDSNRYVFSFMLGGIGEPSKPKEDKNEFEIKIRIHKSRCIGIPKLQK